MLRIVTEDRPAWSRTSPRAWMRKTDYPTWEFAPAFKMFRKQRADLLAVLEPLPPAGWARAAKVREPLGETLDRSVRYDGDWMAAHERVHWTQIEQIVAAVDGKGAT